MNLPNKITISRICLIPLVVFFYLADFIPNGWGKLVSAIIFAIAAITDNIDGRIARKRNLVTNLGKFLDPIADKVLVMSGLLLIIAVPITGEGITQAMPAVWPVWFGIVCGVIILARELIISAFRQIAATKNLVLAADKAGKIKAFTQDVTIFLYMIYAFLVAGFWTTIQGTTNTIICVVLLVLLALSTILTMYSGVQYMVRNRQVLKDGGGGAKLHTIMGQVLNEFDDDGSLSIEGVAERFNMSEKKAQKLLDQMVQLGYISDEGEILLSDEEYQEIFGSRGEE